MSFLIQEGQEAQWRVVMCLVLVEEMVSKFNAAGPVWKLVTGAEPVSQRWWLIWDEVRA